MTIDKILAAIDSSNRSQSVFEMAVSLARSTGASLMLLHVLSEEDTAYPILPTYAYYSVLQSNNDGVLYQKFNEYKQRKVKFLQNLTQKAIALGVDAEYDQSSGIPGWEICEQANNWSADLIVVGSRGLKGMKEMFVGSVSNYVTHHAPCSVLLVRTDTDFVPYSVDSKQAIVTEAPTELIQEY